LLKPNNEIAYYNLSLAFQRLGLSDWAIANAAAAVQLEPSNPHPLVALAIAQWSQGDRSAALATYRQALSLDGRYRDRDHLQHLTRAGFSLEQIALSEQIYNSLP
jgi:tetratricopeptide (TPR) repeat protein